MQIKFPFLFLILIFIIGCGADDPEPLPAKFLEIVCVDGKVEISFTNPPRDVHVEYIEHAFSYSGDFGKTGLKLPTTWHVKDKTILTPCAPSVSRSYVYFIGITWLHGEKMFACPCRE